MNAFYEHHQDSVAMHFALPRRQIAATSVQSRRQFRRGFMVEVAAECHGTEARRAPLRGTAPMAG